MDHISTLNSFIAKYPTLPYTSVTLEQLRSDREILDACIDYIIALFNQVGLTEDYAPTMDGILLDACLEYLTSLRDE